MSGASNRFDQYIPFFGRANDFRLRLFLATLYEQAVHHRNQRVAAGGPGAPQSIMRIDMSLCIYQGNDCVLPTPMTVAVNTVYIARAPNAIHDEWVNFAGEVSGRMYDLVAGAARTVTRGTPDNDARLKVINDLSGPQQNGSIPQFMQQLILLLTANIMKRSAGGQIVPILPGFDDWVNVFRFTYLNFNGTYFYSLFWRDPSLGRILPNSGIFTNVQINQRPIADSNTTAFSVDMNKYIRQRLEEDSLKAMTAPVVSSFFLDPPDANKRAYYRVNGELSVMDATGNVVPVGHGSAEFKKLVETDKCFSSGFKEDGTHSCQQYFTDCLRGTQDGINKCKDYLLVPTFWDDAAKEVNAMNPEIAKVTLKEFKWGVKVYNDPIEGSYDIPIDVNEWLASLRGKVVAAVPAPGASNYDDHLLQAEYDAIAANTKLLGYLGLLVEKLSNNPSILNPNFSGLPPQQTTKLNTHMSQFLSPIIATNAVNASTLARLQAAAQQRNRIRGFVGMRGGPFGMIFPMTGGAVTPLSEEDALNPNPVLLAGTLDAFYKSLINRLNNYGKKIAPGDEAQIINLIAELKKNEIKLNKIIAVMTSYARLHELYATPDNNTVLNLDTMHKFNEKHANQTARVQTKQNNLFSILNSILAAVNDQNTTQQIIKSQGSAVAPAVFRPLV